MDNYLTLASTILRDARRPMSPKQILQAAYQRQIVPPDLFGKTQHKTLQARLSEDILRHKSKSLFMRTGPGLFFLRSFVADKNIPSRYKSEYNAPFRADQLRRFLVPIVKPLKELTVDGFQQLGTLSELSEDKIEYAELSSIWNDPKISFLRIMVILRYKDGIFLYRASHPHGDVIESALSLGAVGFVKLEDKSLFSQDPLGIEEAAYRTLIERLQFGAAQLDELQTPESFKDIRLIIGTIDERRATPIIAVYTFVCSSNFSLPDSLPAETLIWRKFPLQVNNLDDLDPWSRYIISDERMHTAIAI